MNIPFNKPYLTGKELHYIAEAHSKGQLAGDGYFTKQCSRWLQQLTSCSKALLTHSCTAALEMAALLCDIKPGDEVILPSYTFVSTANAFAIRGAVPVFVDIRPDTLNINEALIESAITDKTKAIVPVHYAGVACEMDAIMDIADHFNLFVIEDAAQGLMSSYKGKPLGSIGHLGCYSFHETKNVISGEGGALIINDNKMIDRAEIIREKGTNRSQFFRGQVDKYTWVDIGSSYLPGELIAAFLWAQIQEADSITSKRIALWNQYSDALSQITSDNRRLIPVIPDECKHNAHMYYLLMQDVDDRSRFIDFMKNKDINCVFHYVPLHSAPKGTLIGKTSGDLSVTNTLSERLVRLPLWVGLDDNINTVIDIINNYLQSDH